MSVLVHSGSGEVGKRPSDGEVRRGEGTDRAGNMILEQLCLRSIARHVI